MDKLQQVHQVFDNNILREISGFLISCQLNIDRKEAIELLFEVYFSRRNDIIMRMYLHEKGKEDILVDNQTVMRADQEDKPFYHPLTGEEVKDFRKKVYYCFVKLPVFHLNLTRKWFDMIKSGEKKEEYREITDHWRKRFVNGKIKIKGVCYHPTDIVVCFSNGYANDRPQIWERLVGLTTKTGMPEWGAVPERQYYVLQLK